MEVEGWLRYSLSLSVSLSPSVTHLYTQTHTQRQTPQIGCWQGKEGIISRQKPLNAYFEICSFPIMKLCHLNELTPAKVLYNDILSLNWQRDSGLRGRGRRRLWKHMPGWKRSEIAGEWSEMWKDEAPSEWVSLASWLFTYACTLDAQTITTSLIFCNLSFRCTCPHKACLFTCCF